MPEYLCLLCLGSRAVQQCIFSPCSSPLQLMRERLFNLSLRKRLSNLSLRKRLFNLSHGAVQQWEPASVLSDLLPDQHEELREAEALVPSHVRTVCVSDLPEH